MKTAPEIPTEAELNELHALSDEARTMIARQRCLVSELLMAGGFMAALGSCSDTAESEPIAMVEGNKLSSFQESTHGLAVAQRHCIWKPRTNELDWHGEETTNPVAAHGLVTRQATRYGHVAMELAHQYHLSRYGNRLAFAWSGALNVNERDLVLRLGLTDTTLPFGVKNNRSGDIEPALGLVTEINQQRQLSSVESAPAIVIWRGGSEFTSPRAWESQRQKIYEQTQGHFIDDPAHGSSAAHDPQGHKSNYGQQKALEHITELFTQGYPSAGVLIETSDIKSRTDPNLPFEVGLSAAKELAKLAIKNLRRKNHE